MKKKTLFQQNPYLRDPPSYKQALRVNVDSSMAIEGVRTVHRNSKDGCFVTAQSAKTSSHTTGTHRVKTQIQSSRSKEKKAA